MGNTGAKQTRQAPKVPRKYNKKASNAEPTAEPMEISESSTMKTSDFLKFYNIDFFTLSVNWYIKLGFLKCFQLPFLRYRSRKANQVQRKLPLERSQWHSIHHPP